MSTSIVKNALQISEQAGAGPQLPRTLRSGQTQISALPKSFVTIHKKAFQALSGPADYWGWIAEGRYDHEWRVYDQYLKPEHAFIDLGAWVGAHSMYASRSAKTVVSVEPDPVAFCILEANIGLLDLGPQTLLCRKAVGLEGSITLGSGMLGASTTRVNLAAGGGIGEATETFLASSVTLRKLAESFPDPLFIKIDVEGSEESIFKDLAFFSERKPILLVELHPFWWADPLQAWKDFDAVKSLYQSTFEIPHPNSNTWVLADA